MKLSKKGITVLSFTVGACLFVSTAFADTLLGSGYDRLKGSIKTTAAMMEKGMDNYTIEQFATIKDNGQAVMQFTGSEKMDRANQASERTSETTGADGKATSSYYYSDAKFSVNKHINDDKYYVSEYPADVKRNPANFENPFNEKGAAEMEKIFDAVVGSLKDYVQVEEGTNGAKVYSGSLSETQVPAIANAVASFGFKEMLKDDQSLPLIESDIFVKKVVGSALENKAGYMENVTGDITLSGKDKNGVQHDFTLNVILKLSNVGNTKIVKPDLTGDNVEKVSYNNGFSDKYEGTYKNNIIMEKDGKFVKIGERTIEITSVEGDKVTGKYTESVNPGFEKEYPDQDVFTFEYNSTASSAFTYTNSKGEQKSGMIHPDGTGKIYFDMNMDVTKENTYKSKMKPFYDGEFDRVFE